MHNKIIKELKIKSNKEKAKQCAQFFKTGSGQYGEGDIFIGVTVPVLRKIAKKYIEINLKDLQNLIQSPIHEYRLTAFIILTYKFVKTKDEKIKKQIYNYYLKNRRYVNNWDLVDVTTPKVVGAYLLDKINEREILYKYARSKKLWEKRIAILATFTFLRDGQFKDALQISKILLNDKHDLIHKAVGWMLREIGKKDLVVEERFLKKYYKKMPRTMLRYAIERFEEKKRLEYLRGEI